MFKLLKYLKHYTLQSILGPLFKLSEAALELLVPLVVAAIVDQGITAGDRSAILWYSLLMVAFGLIGLALSVTAQYFSAKAAVGFTTRVRSALFRHIQGFTYTQLDQIGTSTLITRMTSDMNQVQSAVNLTLRLLLRSPFVVLGAMVMAFTIDWKAALVFVVTIPVLSVVVFGIMLICIPLYKKVQAALDRVLGRTRENLSGVRVIRAFCKEEEEIAEFDARNRVLTGAQKFVGRISALMNPLTFALINLAIILLIHTGALRVEAGILTQGAVVALYNYMSQILVELIKLASMIISLTKGVACGNRIQAVLELPTGEPVRESGETAAGTALVFRHVSFRYEGAQEDSLTDISLTLKPGETLGVIGGTGSGKSTFANLIPRFYEATEGVVLVGGKDVCSLPAGELRSRIGTVPQKAVLFKGTIRENLCWGNENAADEELHAALSAAQAAEIVAAKGLDAPVEQNGRNLSGGQRQRLTIARALVKKPEILILDDSASALDFATDAALRRALRELPWKPATVIISQRTSSIAHADQILVLEDGEAVGLGTHEALLESCPVYKEIYDSQFGGAKA
ncbi:MAG: ABC transporter ATP-binding protein [Clostridia bacterium]|nr:ABC transporter ATP-binding protein [Clostridia bacterium]